jgi:hypothetical protein
MEHVYEVDLCYNDSNINSECGNAV